jgi:hypothetical protein
MTPRIACVAGALALAASTASAQTDAGPRPQVATSIASRPMITAGLFEVREGKSKGSAGHTGEYPFADMGSTVYIAPCGALGAAHASTQISAFATDVWVMSGKVLELNDQYASVQLGWRRTRRNGQDESSPEQAATLTLKRGERHTLETIAVPATGSCDARSISFDVVFASRSELYGITDADYVRGGGRSSSGGARSGYVQGGAQQAGSGGGAMSFSASGAASPALERLTADLWLVRSTPGQPDETLHLASQLIPIPVAYSFPPVTIQTAVGPIMVKVEGTLEAGLAPDGQRRFHFVAGRTITASTSSRPARDVKPLVEGSNKVTFAMPEGDDVLAFEMPPLRTPEGTTLPDRLSIRVRISRSPVR